MPFPRWLAKINKRVFNPRAVEKGKYPVVTHVGRVSGSTYRTPLDAFPTDTGYVLVARYGPRSDWVQNVIAEGAATLRVDGVDHELVSPRLLGPEKALEHLSPSDRSAGLSKVEDFIVMDHKE